MNKLIRHSISVILILLLAACMKEAKNVEEDPTVDFHVQYIRTDGCHEGEEYPKIFWITSVKELEDHYTSNKDKYDLESRTGGPLGFTDAIKEYDDSFFEKNDLIFILLEEGSGSIRHEVTGLNVTAINEGEYRYEICPEIVRYLPEVMTDDMAEWHIIVEIDKVYGKTVSRLRTPLITNEKVSVSEYEPAGWDNASVIGPNGQIMVSIPNDWIAEEATAENGKMSYGQSGLVLRPKDAGSGQIELFCEDGFAVCGTELFEEKIVLAGQTATVGTFDDHKHWDFIVFRFGDHRVVVQHTDCSSWSEEMWGEILTILDTLRFDDGITE